MIKQQEQLLITPSMVRAAYESGRNLVVLPLFFVPAIPVDDLVHTDEYPHALMQVRGSSPRTPICAGVTQLEESPSFFCFYRVY
jgi:hypothetical protein